MENDPIFMFFDAAAVAVLLWWCYKLLAPTHHATGHWPWRVTLLTALVVSVGTILFVLESWASFDVVDDPYYILGYLSLGVLWISMSAKFLGIFADIRFQQDVRDRNNLAAALTIGGLLTGSAAAYAGGNIGDGPGPSVVMFSAILSTTVVYGSAWLMATFSDGEERITVDHDLGAAVRMAAVAIAVGIIAGRGAAGDWVSAEGTVADFVEVTWPVLPLVVAAIANEKLSPPNYSEVGLGRSVVLAAVVIAGAVYYVNALGQW